VRIYAKQSHARRAAEDKANEFGAMFGIYCRRVSGCPSYIVASMAKGESSYFPGGRDCWLLIETQMPTKWDR